MYICDVLKGGETWARRLMLDNLEHFDVERQWGRIEYVYLDVRTTLNDWLLHVGWDGMS